ncbi:fimbrial protein [Winslowiella toletana]|uniref:fimbrial protein n=1 Tax=Winslowiella toletana TaxID=92490 RepID=UPI0028BF4547|nr:fimbrial protein [Winslowiella toletana]WNN45248.1 fimbrial protein [Winslowiella toletana]
MKHLLISAILFNMGTVLSPAAFAADLQIDFSGSVVATPCNIDPASQAQKVNIGSVVDKIIYRDGHTAQIPFEIKLTGCSTNVRQSVNVTFTGTEDPVLPGKLIINKGDNGVALALFDENNAALNLGTATAPIGLQTGETILSFSANVIGHPDAIRDKTVTAGAFSSVANFELSYN